MSPETSVPLTLEHLQEIVDECTQDLLFARGSNEFDFLYDLVDEYMSRDAEQAEHEDRLPHVWHLDDYLVAQTIDGLAAYSR
jgi:hypothetical protein